MSEWTIHEGQLDAPDVVDLLAQHFREMRAASPPSACHVLPGDALKSAAIRFFALRDGAGELLGIGALKTIDSDHGEIKSMRTTDAAAGRGVGRAMLGHLTATARDMGMVRLSLETGNIALFDAANRLYQREGFARCGPFGGYADTPFTLFYTKLI